MQKRMKEYQQTPISQPGRRVRDYKELTFFGPCYRARVVRTSKAELRFAKAAETRMLHRRGNRGEMELGQRLRSRLGDSGVSGRAWRELDFSQRRPIWD
jgi:hypothetical protein